MKPSTVPFSTLLADLADPSSQVRRQTINRIMSRRKERGRAFASLLTLLTDPDDQVRKAAIKALGQLRDPQTIPALAQVLTQPNARLRQLALHTLVQVDLQQAFPHVLTALHDPSVSVRREATSALRRLGDARAIGSLIAVLGNGDERARRNAVEYRVMGVRSSPYASCWLIRTPKWPGWLGRLLGRWSVRNSKRFQHGPNEVQVPSRFRSLFRGR